MAGSLASGRVPHDGWTQIPDSRITPRFPPAAGCTRPCVPWPVVRPLISAFCFPNFSFSLRPSVRCWKVSKVSTPHAQPLFNSLLGPPHTAQANPRGSQALIPIVVIACGAPRPIGTIRPVATATSSSTRGWRRWAAWISATHIGRVPIPAPRECVTRHVIQPITIGSK